MEIIQKEGLNPEIAIVTDIAGTTRDRIEHWTAFNGVPLRIVDTAGLRDTTDVVESKGIERSLQALKEADIVLALSDASGRVADDGDALKRVEETVRSGTPVLHIANKCDLASESVLNELQTKGAIAISAKTGAGLEELKSRVLDLSDMAGGTEEVFLARERHLECLRRPSHPQSPGDCRQRLRYDGAPCRRAAPCWPFPWRNPWGDGCGRTPRHHLQPILHRQVSQRLWI